MQEKILINNQIKSERVRIIDETGKQLGILETEKAIQMAKDRGLDLIQVTEKVEPPICKFLDYGKYLYHLKKREKESKHKKGGEIKEIRLTFKISEHDLEIKARQAEKFLKRGDKVKIEMKLRGREKTLQGFAEEKLKKFLEVLEKLIPIKIEKELKKEIGGLTMIIIKK